jgi:nicotinate-nucleotide adenylyltransferase
VCLIPAAVPPHKLAPRETPELRLAMTRLLAEEDERLGVDDIELHRDGPSFTVDTLRELHARRPENAFRLIIGSDMAKSFASWRAYREILFLAPPLIAERPDSMFSGDEFLSLMEDEAELMNRGRFPMLHVDASSTAVRRLVAEGADDRVLLTLLTRPVLDFVRLHRLYT